MDESLGLSSEGHDIDLDSLDPREVVLADPQLEETSYPFLQSWNRLISTTNWDKGRIICQWREALVAAGAPAVASSDEAWSRLAGGVTPQHVGRLRRVFHRFHETYQEYEGLYWSHFQAALDWDDAEMWLEGAARSGWSISQMRQQRWETLGAPEDRKPRDEDIVVVEMDEDVRREDDSASETISDSPSVVRPAEDVVEFSPESADPNEAFREAADAAPFDAPPEEGDMILGPFRPFEDLPDLPDDLAEAVESLKLAIVNHKLSGWRDVSCDDVLATLNALKQLALAPAES